MPIVNRRRSSGNRRKWLPHAVLLLVCLLIGTAITLFSRQSIQQNNREKRWFEQESKAGNEFKYALISMIVFVDDRQRLMEGGLTRTVEDDLMLKASADEIKVYAGVDQARREAEKLRPMLPGLADHQRFEKRLTDLLTSLQNTRKAAQAVAKAKNQQEIRQALNIFAQ
jgi:hypothetical protein